MGGEVTAKDLRGRLRRAERLNRLGAFALVGPLLLFLLVVFVMPIADMMRRSVHDPELGRVWPQVVVAIGGWTDRSRPPPEPVFKALAADMRASREAGNLAVAARRLNYDIENGRSLVQNTARRLPAEATSWTETFVAADPRWGEPETWGAIDRAAGPLTSFFLLAALDLQRHADGAITPAPPQKSVYLDLLQRTFGIGLGVTVLCLLLGFPVAYLIAALPPARANLLLILVLLPFWTSLLVRTTAWVVVLQERGLVNELMLWLGLIDRPVRLIYNRIGVVIAMTHVLLPFMILPLYSVMKAIRPDFMRAAASLGAPPATAFMRVYLPQTLPGIAAGTLLVFIMAIGYYITPALVGGAGDQMISYFIAFYTSDTVNWGMASALGAVLLVATLILYAVYVRLIGVDRMRLG